jgi:hypothetical protein
MITVDLNARPASRVAKQSFSLKLLRFLALRKRPQPVPFDYAEIERFRRELELKKVHMQMLSRLKVM